MYVIRASIAAGFALAIGVLVPSAASAQAAARGDAAQVAVDKTGRLRAPTPEERRELLELRQAEPQQRRQRLAEPVPVIRSDGAIQAAVPEHLESVSVARIENGRVVTRCFDDPAAAKRFLAGESTAPAAEVK